MLPALSSSVTVIGPLVYGVSAPSITPLSLLSTQITLPIVCL